MTRSVYVVVLSKDLPSPLAPESDDEKAEREERGEAARKPPSERTRTRQRQEKKEPVKVTIDFENIGQRILALPIPARNYQGLAAGKEGMLLPRRRPAGAT